MIDELIDAEIRKLIDPDAWNQQVAREQDNRDMLRVISENRSAVMDYVAAEFGGGAA